MPALVGAAVAVLILITLVAFFITRLLSEQVARNENTRLSEVTPTPEPPIYHDLPRTFPRDIILPSGGNVTGANESENDWTATFITPLSTDEANAFYLGELPKSGWIITNQTQGGGLTILYVKKTREAVVVIGKSELGTTVSITILK